MESLYQAAFEIWNQGIIIAISLFTTSPTSAAGGSLYSVAHSVYSTLASIAVPIATIFFLIAIIKDVVMTPPDQQIRRFFGDALRFGIMIGILANLWEIMGVVIEVTDGITNAIFPATSGGDTMLSMSADLQNLINQAKILDPSPTIAGSGGFINWVGDMKDWCTTSL